MSVGVLEDSALLQEYCRASKKFLSSFADTVDASGSAWEEMNDYYLEIQRRIARNNWKPTNRRKHGA